MILLSRSIDKSPRNGILRLKAAADNAERGIYYEQFSGNGKGAVLRAEV